MNTSVEIASMPLTVEAEPCVSGFIYSFCDDAFHIKSFLDTIFHVLPVRLQPLCFRKWWCCQAAFEKYLLLHNYSRELFCILSFLLSVVGPVHLAR